MSESPQSSETSTESARVGIDDLREISIFAQRDEWAALRVQSPLGGWAVGFEAHRAFTEALENFAIETRALFGSSPQLRMDTVLEGVLNMYRGAAALGPALSAVDEPASPQMARSVQASVNRRRKVFEEYRFLNSQEVAEVLGSRSSNRALASDHRTKGRILGVKRGNGYAYPKFQFDEVSHQVRPVIPELIALAQANDWSEEDLLLWLVTPTGYFDDTRPIEHFDDPEDILAGARRRLEPTW